LTRAQDFAFTAQLEIFLGDAEAVLGFAQAPQPRAGSFAQGAVIEKDAA
jgi:hypothetical protein